jgi:hypothetical protein
MKYILNLCSYCKFHLPQAHQDVSSGYNVGDVAYGGGWGDGVHCTVCSYIEAFLSVHEVNKQCFNSTFGIVSRDEYFLKAYNNK